MKTTYETLKTVEQHSNTGKKVLKVFEKLKAKEAKIIKPAPESSNDIVPETLGTPEMMDLEKREYGFDWPTSKGPDIDEYCPEG